MYSENKTRKLNRQDAKTQRKKSNKKNNCAELKSFNQKKIKRGIRFTGKRDCGCNFYGP